ncbi:MAG: sigma-70 family RNA polymerase sigma factor [Chthonomonadales bacterium]
MKSTFNLANKSVNTYGPCTTENKVPSCIDSDEMLLAKYRNGNKRALEILIRRYEKAIYGLAFRLAKNHDDAQEVTSETYLRITRYVVTVQNVTTLPAWINRIVVNVFISMRQSAQRKPTTSLDELTEMYGDSALGAMDETRTSPALLLEAKERTELLNDAVASLPPTQRPLVTLFHHEHRSYEEIANTLNLPIGTVKSRLNRARRALLELLAPHAGMLLSR